MASATSGFQELAEPVKPTPETLLFQGSAKALAKGSEAGEGSGTGTALPVTVSLRYSAVTADILSLHLETANAQDIHLLSSEIESAEVSGDSMQTFILQLCRPLKFFDGLLTGILVLQSVDGQLAALLRLSRTFNPEATIPSLPTALNVTPDLMAADVKQRILAAPDFGEVVNQLAQAVLVMGATKGMRGGRSRAEFRRAFTTDMLGYIQQLQAGRGGQAVGSIGATLAAQQGQGGKSEGPASSDARTDEPSASPSSAPRSSTGAGGAGGGYWASAHGQATAGSRSMPTAAGVRGSFDYQGGSGRYTGAGGGGDGSRYGSPPYAGPHTGGGGGWGAYESSGASYEPGGYRVHGRRPRGGHAGQSTSTAGYDSLGYSVAGAAENGAAHSSALSALQAQQQQQQPSYYIVMPNSGSSGTSGGSEAYRQHAQTQQAMLQQMAAMQAAAPVQLPAHAGTGAGSMSPANMRTHQAIMPVGTWMQPAMGMQPMLLNMQQAQAMAAAAAAANSSAQTGTSHGAVPVWTVAPRDGSAQ